MRFLAVTIMAGAFVAVAGCTQDDRPARAQQTMIPAGEPVTCVTLSQLRETRVIDDQTIDFIMRDGTILRNTLPNRCPSLGFERAFSYSTSLNRLCNVDIITVVAQGGGPRRGASCGLGVFVPVKPADAPAQ
jgi:hypothetical protein